MPLRVSKKYIRQFVFNCDRTKIAVTNKTPQIAIVSYSDFDLMQTDTSPTVLHLKSHTSAIVWCDFSPSKPNLLLSASYDNSIKLWQLSSSSDGAAADSGDVDYTVIASFEFNRIIRYAIFSPLNEDCLIVGTHSTPFYVFNTKAKLNNYPPTISTGKPICDCVALKEREYAIAIHFFVCLQWKSLRCRRLRHPSGNHQW